MKHNGTYEDGVRDTIKFLKDNSKIEFKELPDEEQLINLLLTLSGRIQK